MTSPHRSPVAGPARLGGEAPWRRSAFWLLQLVVLALFLIRVAIVVAFHLPSGSVATEYTVALLFLVPVVYAALSFGFAGAVATAATVTVLSLPQVVISATGGDRASAAVQVAQVAILAATAALVGQWVTSERRARLIAERAREDHERTEHLYRELFASNLSPILIVDLDGCVVDMNEAAHRLFDPIRDGRGDGGGAHPRIMDVVGPEAARIVLTELVTPTAGGSGNRLSEEPVVVDSDAGPLLLRPAVTRLGRAGVDEGLQVVFADVTAETLRRQRTEAYAAYVLEGLEDERRHLAQELHDGPVQALIHLCRLIDTAAEPPGSGARTAGEHAARGSGTDPGTCGGGDLSDLRRIAEATVAELRGIARGLRPPVLDDLGLAASIRQLVADASARSGARGTFSTRGSEQRLPAGIELTLFRITQEAVSNIERHARASSFSVELEFAGDAVNLTVLDDGVGFDPNAAGRRAGTASMGLAGMSERARLVGGTLRIDATPGGGCRVRVQKLLEHTTMT